MGIVSLKQSMELFWLGRYVERVYLTLRHLDQLYDVLLDIDKEAYKKFCAELEIPDIYEDRLDFVNNYLFSKENPDSIYSNLSRAYDNGIGASELYFLSISVLYSNGTGCLGIGKETPGKRVA